MSEWQKHWAEDLQTGDKCIATIRHETNGDKNINDVKVIVIWNDYYEKIILAFYNEGTHNIPWNDLTKIEPHEVSTVKCDLCNKEWIVVRPQCLMKLFCPNCVKLVYFK